MSIGEMTVVDYELMQDKISTPTAPLKKKSNPLHLMREELYCLCIDLVDSPSLEWEVCKCHLFWWTDKVDMFFTDLYVKHFGTLKGCKQKVS